MVSCVSVPSSSSTYFSPPALVFHSPANNPVTLTKFSRFDGAYQNTRTQSILDHEVCMNPSRSACLARPPLGRLAPSVGTQWAGSFRCRHQLGYRLCRSPGCSSTTVHRDSAVTRGAIRPVWCDAVVRRSASDTDNVDRPRGGADEGRGRRERAGEAHEDGSRIGSGLARGCCFSFMHSLQMLYRSLC